MKNFYILIDFLKKLYQNRYMIKMMVVRDLKARYAGSAFGFLWAVIEPLALVAIYGVIFGFFFKARPAPGVGTDSFFVYLVCGIIPFQFFTKTVSQATGAIMSNRNLIKKSVGFHAEILPIITTLTNIFTHLIGVLMLLVAVAAFGVKLTVHVPLVLLYLFIFSVFTVGLGWVVSGMNVFLRDIQQVVSLVLLGWFFFTPIFYSPTIIPDSLLPIVKLNPVYHFVFGYRYALIAGKMLPWQDLAYLTGIAVITFGLGGLFFRKVKPLFAEVL